MYRKGGFSAAGSSMHLRAGLEIVGLASARVVQFKATWHTYIRPTPAQKRVYPFTCMLVLACLGKVGMIFIPSLKLLLYR